MVQLLRAQLIALYLWKVTALPQLAQKQQTTEIFSGMQQLQVGKLSRSELVKEIYGYFSCDGSIKSMQSAQCPTL